MARLSVTFQPHQASVAVPPETSLLEAAAMAGLRLHSPCGGQGRCGKCAVRIVSGAGEATPLERGIFASEELAEGWRLACATRVQANVEVVVPPEALVVEHRIAVEGIGREILVEPNVQKLALHLPTPSVDDPRADLLRLTDALGGRLGAPDSLRTVRELPGVLREAGYRITAVLVGDALAAIEPGDTAQASYGVAVDVGTTTVVAYLCHLPTGEVAGTASDLNPQSRYGEDVISRLRLASSEADGLEQLRSAVSDCINDLVGRAAKEAGVDRKSIYELSVVGNTCMTHLLLGLPPVGLAALPFVPAFRQAQCVRAAELGISIHAEARVYVAPNIGGFVGADTVGVILASELDHTDGLQAAVDIGTNGEIVVAKDRSLYACSTAAGPAFEGARISQGMRAAAGAIDEVRIEDDLVYHVLGDEAPSGICGSGLVDAIAELVRIGVVEEGGRLRRPEEVGAVPEKVRCRLIENDGEVQFVLAWREESGSGKPVAVSGRDVRELQLAKSAIYAGISILLEKLGHGPAEVERLLLAGAFGNYIRRESAVAIGLIPALPLERIQPIGNAAGLGARLMLASVSLRRRAEEIAEGVEHIDLSQQEGFYERFAEAMALRPLPQDE